MLTGLYKLQLTTQDMADITEALRFRAHFSQGVVDDMRARGNEKGARTIARLVARRLELESKLSRMRPAFVGEIRETPEEIGAADTERPGA
jgi:hypothetical protein